MQKFMYFAWQKRMKIVKQDAKIPLSEPMKVAGTMARLGPMNEGDFRLIN